MIKLISTKRKCGQQVCHISEYAPSNLFNLMQEQEAQRVRLRTRGTLSSRALGAAEGLALSAAVGAGGSCGVRVRVRARRCS